MNVRRSELFRRIKWSNVKSTLEELAPYLKPVRHELILAVMCSLGAVAMIVARPWPIKMVFDYALLPDGRVKWVFPFALMKGYGAMGVVTISCGLLLVISLLWGFFTFYQRFLIASAGQQVTFTLRRRLFNHLQRLTILYHRKRNIGDLVLRVTGDANMMRDMLVDGVVILLTDGIVLIAMIAVMAYMDWQLMVLSLSVFPLLAFSVFQISGDLRSAVKKQRQREGRVATAVGEMLQAIAVIQAFGREDHEADKFAASNRRNLRQGLRTVRLEAKLARVSELIIAVGTGIVLWFGVKRVVEGVLTPGDLIVFTHYLAGMYKPLRRISRVTGRVTKANACAQRVFGILRTDERVRIHSNARPVEDMRGRVTFKDVTFGYNPGQPVLNGITFTVKPGKTVAIVGPNGAGKSTLCSFLPRLFEPDSGTITIDGNKINRYRIDELRDHIGVVLQQSMLFSATVAENVAYGRLDASREEIEAACEAANAADFIKRLPDGYDTVIGERGDTLSGGQRQKLAIARAMIKQPKILVLDEPTAALDAKSAKQLNETLSQISKGVTTFRVGHSLAELQRADLIIVIENGSITQSGTHDELIREDGWYRTTYFLQQEDSTIGKKNPDTNEAREDAANRAGGKRHATG